MESQFIGGWVWMITSIPCALPSEKAAAARFRRYLDQTGWFKIGRELWARPCHRAGFNGIVEDVSPHVPPGANVRFVWITDYQWGKSRVVVGERR
jgi:CRISPR/Cas system-associated protein endoribonuclease Cas2